jgi:hypothetical protein
MKRKGAHDLTSGDGPPRTVRRVGADVVDQDPGRSLPLPAPGIQNEDDWGRLFRLLESLATGRGLEAEVFDGEWYYYVLWNDEGALERCDRHQVKHERECWVWLLGMPLTTAQQFGTASLLTRAVADLSLALVVRP